MTSRRSFIVAAGAAGAFGSSAVRLAMAAADPAATAAAATAAAPPTPGNPPGFIFGKGPPGRCDDAANGSPIVKWHPGEKRWWMWYYCRDTEWPKDIAPAFGTGRIALAKSDDGIRWERFDGPLAKGAVMVPSDDPDAFDTLHIGSSDVTYHDGEWIMWYFGGDATTPKELGGVKVPEGYQARGYRCRPGIARSKDGINWTRVKGNATGGAAIDIGDYIYAAFPSGIWDGKRFLMYYSMLSPKMFYWETHVSESTDLVNWRPLGPWRWDTEPAIWERGGSVTRHMLPNPDKSGPKWLMIYTGMDGRFQFYPRLISAAASDDAIVWRRLYDDPILIPGALNTWDGGGTSYGHLVPMGEKLHLYYYGFKDMGSPYEPGRGVGLAISEKGDLRGFRKYKS